MTRTKLLEYAERRGAENSKEKHYREERERIVCGVTNALLDSNITRDEADKLIILINAVAAEKPKIGGATCCRKCGSGSNTSCGCDKKRGVN